MKYKDHIVDDDVVDPQQEHKHETSLMQSDKQGKGYERRRIFEEKMFRNARRIRASDEAVVR